MASKYDNDSTNSGLPTSKTPLNKKKFIPNTREKTDKKIGGQKGHKKHQLLPFTEEEATEVVEIVPKKCPHCGSENIKELSTSNNKCETDYEVKIIKRLHKFIDCECEDCHKKIHAPIPNDLKEENQYGKTVQSLCVCLTNEIYTPFNKTVKLLSGITNNEINVSEGYVAKLQKRAAIGLNKFKEEVKEYILSQPVYGWDEGVISINTKNGILRVYVTDLVVLIVASESKSKESIDKDEILNKTGKDVIVMHDHLLLNYNDEYCFDNAECLIHLIRRLRKMHEKTTHEYLKEFVSYLSEVNKKRNKMIENKKDSFTKEEQKEIHETFKKFVDKGKEINKNSKTTENYFKEEEASLLKDLEKYEESYLKWVDNFQLPSTNNACESTIRPTKSKLKISGQFRNLDYAEYYATVRTYIETCKRNGINIIEACARLMEGKCFSLEEILNYKKDTSN